MLIKHRGVAPNVDPSAYVAPTATLVGNVTVGPGARIMYGAVLDSEASEVVVGEGCIIAENAVLRATAAGAQPHPVVLGDHVFVGPHATLLGCHVERCCYLATSVTCCTAPGSVRVRRWRWARWCTPVPCCHRSASSHR